MKKLWNRLDPKYAKVCLYAGVTALIIFGLGLLLFHIQDFFVRLWMLISAVMKPLIYGALISYLLTPLVHFIEIRLASLPFVRKKPERARKPAIAITLLLILAVLGLIIVLMVSVIYRSVDRIDFTQIEAFLDSIRGQFNEFRETIEAKLSEYGISIGGVGSKVGAFFGNVRSFFTTALFSIIFSIYFLLDRANISGYWKRVLRLLGGGPLYDTTMRVFSEADICFSGYIRGQFIDATIVAILISIAMTIGGVPYAIVIGVLTGIGNLIPYVGGVTGIMAISVACFSSGDLQKFIIGLICLAAVMFIDANIINPHLLSDNIQVHPLLVVAALIAGSAVGGFAGMLIAVPTAALLKLEFDRYLEQSEAEKRVWNAFAEHFGRKSRGEAEKSSSGNRFPGGDAEGKAEDSSRSDGGNSFVSENRSAPDTGTQAFTGDSDARASGNRISPEDSVSGSAASPGSSRKNQGGGKPRQKRRR